MKALLILIAFIIGSPAYAVDPCNPYLKQKQSVRTNLTCTIKSIERKLPSFGATYRPVFDHMLWELGGIIEALDYKAISPKEAQNLADDLFDRMDAQIAQIGRDENRRIDELEARQMAAVGLMYQAPIPTFQPINSPQTAQPLDITCRRDIRDAFGGVRCQSN